MHVMEKPYVFIANREKLCISPEIFHNKVTKKEVLKVAGIYPELKIPVVKEESMLEEEKLEKNPYEVWIVQNLEEQVLGTSMEQIEHWPIVSTDTRYVQYDHKALDVKAPEDRCGTKIYKKLQVNKRDVKEIDFDSARERLRKDNLDVFEGVKSQIMYSAKYNDVYNINSTYMTADLRSIPCSERSIII